MTAHPPPRLVVVVGPTASGKSALAIELAERANAEVVSADSQQVYIGMDIGTGKVPAAVRARTPHHLIDVARPDEDMTAQRFVELADAAIVEIAKRGRAVVVAGGTMLYVRALLRGLFEGPPADPAVRAALLEKEELRGRGHLFQRLQAVDPALAARIEPNDLRRIVRALEVFDLTGEPMSVHQSRHDHRHVPRRYPARVIALEPDRGELVERIESRVDEMMVSGLLDEVVGLRAMGYGPTLRSQQAIGYAELHQHLDGAWDLEEAVRVIKRNSRRYARRQVSWYRGDADVEHRASPGDVDVADLGRYLSEPGGATKT